MSGNKPGILLLLYPDIIFRISIRMIYYGAGVGGTAGSEVSESDSEDMVSFYVFCAGSDMDSVSDSFFEVSSRLADSPSLSAF